MEELPRIEKLRLKTYVCYGVKFWNRKTVTSIFGGKAPVVFSGNIQSAITTAKKRNAELLCWASLNNDEVLSLTDKAQIPLLNIEDGFIRSVGLGAGLARGGALSLDDQGIYYSAAKASRLEVLLNTYCLSPLEVTRAKGMVELLRSTKLTKYNWDRRTNPIRIEESKRQVILVAGQVSDDQGVIQSISGLPKGSRAKNINEALLRAVRNDFPDAFIVYKPHPDVQAGLRKGQIREQVCSDLCDSVVSSGSVVDHFKKVDRVATFSSLTGFEALIRGVSVTTYGLPFYSGWGLTNDRVSIARRQKKRELHELVYICLAKYMYCIDINSLRETTPELLIQSLAQQKQSRIHRLTTSWTQHISWAGRRAGL
ncbi:capsular polysaccharide export protein, LipB/KpsS family [Flexibacterium corallicola]|uniref:capsular polysaccharide export protein, LipB/KpsS family n=1 Tax=Flexibacterium corallicola TaxID=3037259 RepID=UPI00286F0EEF|nr:hypothetical protein [Pseudovibrio sp. M1P-2-3]